MKNLNFFTILRWLARLFLIWLVFSIERVFSLPIFSLILTGSLAVQEVGWRRFGLLFFGSWLVAALYFWPLPLAVILVWSLYFWFKVGDSVLGSQTSRYLLGGWLGGVVVAWFSFGLTQSQQLVYLVMISLVSLIWLKRKQAWQFGRKY